MKKSDRITQDLKKALEEAHGREFSDEEVSDALLSMQRLADITYAIATEEIEREKKLKENPKGFHVDGGGTCGICGSHFTAEDTWYDKYGVKCLPCQKAIDSKIIPASVVIKKDSWYSEFELEMYFNVKGADLRNLIKQKVLVPRIIPGNGKKPHFQLFMLRDNKDVLPPKKLVQSRIVKTVHNGEEYYVQEHWYKFVDEKHARRLLKYKISEYFESTFSKPLLTGQFMTKAINPLFSFRN